MRERIAKKLTNILPLLLCAALTLSLAACGNAQAPPTPPPAAQLTDPPFPTGEYNGSFRVMAEAMGTVFRLTDAQQALFDEYKKSLDVNVFKDANPVDIAQVYVECGNQGIWEGEYNLYDPNGVFLTKEEYHISHINDMRTTDIRSRWYQACVMLPYLNDGEFIDDGDDTGHILFDSPTEPDLSKGESTPGPARQMIMSFVKNSGGIWLLASQNPFDYVK